MFYFCVWAILSFCVASQCIFNEVEQEKVLILLVYAMEIFEFSFSES